MKKIKKWPEFWPFVPPKQRIESLAWLTKRITIYQYEYSLSVLVYSGFMKRAQMKKLLRRFRKFIGMSYQEWRQSRPPRLRRW